MKRMLPSQSSVLIGVGGAVVLFGGLYAWFLIYARGWPLALFFKVLALGGGYLLAGGAAALLPAGKNRFFGFLKRQSAILVLLFTGLGAVACYSFTHDQNVKTFRMKWNFGPLSRQWPDTPCIILTFEDFPNRYLVIYSVRVARYVESRESHILPVTFRLQLDRKQVIGRRILRIGSLEHWDEKWQYSGYRGSSLPSPWSGKD